MRCLALEGQLPKTSESCEQCTSSLFFKSTILAEQRQSWRFFAISGGLQLAERLVKSKPISGLSRFTFASPTQFALQSRGLCIIKM